QQVAHDGLEQRAAREQRPDAALLAHRPARAAQGGEVASEVDLVRARRHHPLLEAGGEPLEVAPPVRQARVHVTALRHAGTTAAVIPIPRASSEMMAAGMTSMMKNPTANAAGPIGSGSRSKKPEIKKKIIGMWSRGMLSAP